MSRVSFVFIIVKGCGAHSGTILLFRIPGLYCAIKLVMDFTICAARASGWLTNGMCPALKSTTSHVTPDFSIQESCSDEGLQQSSRVRTYVLLLSKPLSAQAGAVALVSNARSA